LLLIFEMETKGKNITGFCLRRVPLVGSNANNSGKAGSFALNVNNTWSNANVNIASQLCLFLKISTVAETLPLGKTQSKAPFSLVGFKFEKLGVK